MRGFYVLLGLIAVGAIACYVPFVLFPGAGIGITLPVIYVPGEHLESFPIPGITNTIFAAILTSAIGILLLGLGGAFSPKEVPSRGQAALELIAELWDGFAKQVAGTKGRQLLPLILGIFFFLLIANLMKVVPGVDTLGEVHCAGIIPNYDNLETKEEKEEAYISFSGYETATNFFGATGLKNEEVLNTGDKMSYAQYDGCKKRHDSHSEEGDHTEETTTEGDHAEEATAEGDHAEEATAEETTTVVASTSDDEDVDTDSYEYRCRPQDNVDLGHDCDLYNITPYVRGASTDLSLTLAIAFLAVVAVQFYGIKELGVAGWGVKFFNLPALGKGGIDSINFAVGFLETILEIMKVVSFAFRLFGAMFAGQVLMFVIVFLAGAFVPVIIIGLEVFVGGIQAFVFAILFLMFAAGAMVSHHDDHDEAHEHH